MAVKVHYVGTKSEVEAFAGVPSGSTGFSTDTGETGSFNGSSWSWGASSSGAVWGAITGSIFDQTDLMGQFSQLDERIDDKQDSNENTDALHNGTQNNETFLYKESGDINGKTAAETVALLKPILDTIYAQL